MALKIGDLITAVIGVVIGLALLPVVTSSVTGAIDVNTSPSVIALLHIVPLLYIIVIVVGMVAYVVIRGKE